MNSTSISKEREYPDDSHMPLSADVIALYNEQITKTGLLILKALDEHGELQQKDLCDVVHTSKNSMSNQLSRLGSIQPKLLNVTALGRIKIYSLTDEARAYLQVHMPPANNSNIRSFTDVNGSEYVGRQALESFGQLRYRLAEPWKVSLNKILTGQVEPLDNDISDSYHRFMNQMASLTLSGHSAALSRVYTAISDTILAAGIKEKVADMLGKDYQLLMPLYRLEVQDPQYALTLIDEILSDMYPAIMQKSSPVPRKVTDEEYYALFYAVSRMRNQFLQCATKEEAIRLWTSPYLHKSWIPQHLAGTFELISQIPKSANT